MFERERILVALKTSGRGLRSIFRVTNACLPNLKASKGVVFMHRQWHWRMTQKTIYKSKIKNSVVRFLNSNTPTPLSMTLLSNEMQNGVRFDPNNDTLFPSIMHNRFCQVYSKKVNENYFFLTMCSEVSWLVII